MCTCHDTVVICPHITVQVSDCLSRLKVLDTDAGHGTDTLVSWKSKFLSPDANDCQYVYQSSAVAFLYLFDCFVPIKLVIQLLLKIAMFSPNFSRFDQFAHVHVSTHLPILEGVDLHSLDVDFRFECRRQMILHDSHQLLARPGQFFHVSEGQELTAKRNDVSRQRAQHLVAEKLEKITNFANFTRKLGKFNLERRKGQKW